MAYITKRRISPKRDYRQERQRHNEKWDRYYAMPAWRKLRDYWKLLNPLCRECLFEGRSVPADHVHHKVPWSWFTLEEDRIKCLTDPDNLVSLCRHHHLEVHQNLVKPDNFEETPYYKKIHEG